MEDSNKNFMEGAGHILMEGSTNQSKQSMYLEYDVTPIKCSAG